MDVSVLLILNGLHLTLEVLSVSRQVAATLSDLNVHAIPPSPTGGIDCRQHELRSHLHRPVCGSLPCMHDTRSPLLSIHRMTAILVSRFLLQLQEASHTILRVDSDDPLHISMGPYDGTPSFIRSLGAVLDPDGLREDHADLDETNQRPDIEEEERTEQVVAQSSASESAYHSVICSPHVTRTSHLTAKGAGGS